MKQTADRNTLRGEYRQRKCDYLKEISFFLAKTTVCFWKEILQNKINNSKITSYKPAFNWLFFLLYLSIWSDKKTKMMNVGKAPFQMLFQMQPSFVLLRKTQPVCPLPPSVSTIYSVWVGMILVGAFRNPCKFVKSRTWTNNNNKIHCNESQAETLLFCFTYKCKLAYSKWGTLYLILAFVHNFFSYVYKVQYRLLILMP